MADLVEKGCEVIVLSRGMELRLKTRPETLELLKSKGVEVHVEETKAAVELKVLIEQMREQVQNVE